MNLGILLPIGSSLTDQKKTGQDKRFIEYYLKNYNRFFEKIFIFSYGKEKFSFPSKCFLVANKFSLNRFLYSFLLPFLNFKMIREIDVFRVMQLTGTIPAILTKIFFQKKFVFTYGYDYVAFAKLEGQKIRPILLKLLEKIAMKVCSGAIVTTKILEKKLQKKYPKIKLFYLPNGVDIKKFKPRSPITNHQLPITKLLFVGRLEKQKNLKNLIEVVALLKNKNKISLLFIGQGKLKLQLLKLAKNLGVNLKISNPVSHIKLVKYYQRADIFCLPSFLEGQPKVLLEAMACGLPCLVGNYAGVEEFQNKKEILTTGFKANQIAYNLEKLIKNQKLKKTLSRNSRKRVEKDFDIDKLLLKEINILRNV